MSYKYMEYATPEIQLLYHCVGKYVHLYIATVQQMNNGN